MTVPVPKAEIPKTNDSSPTTRNNPNFNIWGGLFSFNYLLYKGYYKSGFKNLFLYAAIHITLDKKLADRPHGLPLFIGWFLLMSFATNGIIRNFHKQGGQPSTNKSQNILMVFVGIGVTATIFAIERNL